MKGGGGGQASQKDRRFTFTRQLKEDGSMQGRIAQGGRKHAGQNDIGKEGESTNSRNKAAATATQGTINGPTGDYSQKGRNSKPNSSLAAASTMS